MKISLIFNNNTDDYMINLEKKQEKLVFWGAPKSTLLDWRRGRV